MKLSRLDAKLALVFVASQVALWTGCNAILGNGYGAFDESAVTGPGGEGGMDDGALGNEGGSGSEGGSGGDAMGTGDGAPLDGSVDGGSCPRGICPVSLTAAAGAQRLALTASSVYWTSATGIGRVGRDGSLPLFHDLGGPIPAGLKRGVAVSPAGAPYVTVLSRGAASCSLEVSSCATGFIGSAGLASSIAVDATKVYVGIFDDQTGSMQGGIWQTTLSGASPAPYTMMTDKVLDLRVVGATTYFMTSAGVSSNTLTTMPTSAANLAGDLPAAFDVNGATLVVATTNDHLHVCTISAATTCTLAQLRSAPVTAVIVDGMTMIWAEGGANASIYRAALAAGAAPVLLAEGQAFPSDLAVDATSVFWANHGDPAGVGGAIMKLAK